MAEDFARLKAWRAQSGTEGDAGWRGRGVEGGGRWGGGGGWREGGREVGGLPGS